MPEGTVDLAEQLRAHLESLRAAGVLLLPRPQKALVIQRAAPAPAAVAAPTPEDPLQTRRRELDVLRAEVAACDKCSGLFATRLQTVFGSGAIDAEVLFVGAAPGPDEEAQGEPFAGKGGILLGRIINACGLTHDRVYLLNLIKCKTPKRRAPTNAECLNCRDFFRRQVELVRPKHVVALGEFAAKALTGKKATLAELRGAVHQYRGVPLVCTHHPDDIDADAGGRLKREAWDDVKLLLATMGREVPGAK
jgi:DNA polymerase